MLSLAYYAIQFLAFHALPNLAHIVVLYLAYYVKRYLAYSAMQLLAFPAYPSKNRHRPWQAGRWFLSEAQENRFEYLATTFNIHNVVRKNIHNWLGFWLPDINNLKGMEFMGYIFLLQKEQG